MGSNKQLSLCIITQNDEKLLKDFFQSIGQIADEIIIADIGSTDHSSDIAKEAGAYVYETAWKNDYSEVKNFCLDKAKGRWVLFLQANERISQEQLKKIVPLLDNPNAEGYLLYIDLGSDHYRIASPVQSLRLFRNRKEYRYQYKSFECIPDELISNIIDSGIRIHQFPDPDYHSNISPFSLLKEELDAQPDNSYLQYIYGIELLNQNRNEDSIVYFQSVRRKVNLDYLYAPHLYKCLAWSCISSNRYDDAFEVLDEGVKYFPFYADLLVLRGDLRKQGYQYEEAIRDLENSLKIKEIPGVGVPVSEIDFSIILESLGETHGHLLNYSKALSCYQEALKLNKENHDLLYKIGDLAKKTDDAETLDHLLKAVIERNDIDQMMILFDILYQQREYQKVLANLKHLESYLGKEQIESIKLSCQTMLDELERSAESESYSEIPLQQDDHEEDYDLMEKFLWLNQAEKAKLLLPLILNKEGDDDHFIKLALLWADKDDLDVILQIFQSIRIREKQIEFKQKTIMELLRKNCLESAQELAEFGDHLPLGSLEFVLWSRIKTDKLEKWLREKEQTPIQDTLGFSRAKIHYEAGVFYEKSNKFTESFSAYLRVLQWEPTNDSAQNKIKEFLERDERLYDFLEGKNWILEGSWFHNKEAFVNYVQGLIHFKKQRFEQALESFSKIEDLGASNIFVLAYRISCAWMNGNEAEAEYTLSQQKRTFEIGAIILRICKNSVLEKLSEGYQKYPYSEIIILEKQRISDLSTDH